MAIRRLKCDRVTQTQRLFNCIPLLLLFLFSENFVRTAINKKLTKLLRFSSGAVGLLEKWLAKMNDLRSKLVLFGGEFKEFSELAVSEWSGEKYYNGEGP